MEKPQYVKVKKKVGSPKSINFVDLFAKSPIIFLAGAESTNLNLRKKIHKLYENNFL